MTPATANVLRTTPEAIRAFELDYPMFQGYGEYLRRQGKLELIEQTGEKNEF